MIKVQFFASLRETLGTAAVEIEADGVADVNDVLDRLVATWGSHWEQVLRQEKVLMAVNQQVVDRRAAVADGDEVAFFPPVTGG
jgi:molybdopterin synthase sulfur carrier subunit